MRLPPIEQELYTETGTAVAPGASGVERCIMAHLVPAGAHMAGMRYMFVIEGGEDLNFNQFSAWKLDAWWLPYAGSDLMQTPDTLAEIKTYYDRMVSKVDDTVPTSSWTEDTDPGTGAGGSDGSNEADTTLGDVDLSLTWQPGKISLLTLEDPMRIGRMFASGRQWMGPQIDGRAIMVARDNDSGNAKFRATQTFSGTLRRGVKPSVHGVVAWILTIPADVGLSDFAETSLFPSGAADSRRWETMDFLAPKYDMLGTNVYRHHGAAAGGTGNADEVRRFLVSYQFASTATTRKFKQTSMSWAFACEPVWKRRVQMPAVIKATHA